MTLRGVLLFLAAFSALTSSSVTANAGQAANSSHQAAPRVTASPFGIPFPASRNPQDWQAWRQQQRAQLEARRSTRARSDASGTGSSGIIETIAGAAPFQQPVNALKTGFGEIEGIAEDSNGNLYVASCDLGVVLKVDSSSNTTVYAGKPLPSGPSAQTGDGGPATSARLVCPSGLALDATGNLYISDSQGPTVRVVNAATGVIQTIAGTPGQPGHTGDGGPATAATFYGPSGLALDGNGNLFIEDAEYVRELNLTTGLIQTIAGSGVALSQCALTATNTCPATQVQVYMFGSTLAFAQGHLYAGMDRIYTGSKDFYPYLDGSIVSIDPSTGIMQLLAGGGPNAGIPSSYPAIGLVMEPYGLAADAAGNLYISVFGQPPDGLSNHSPSVPSIDELSASDHTLHVIAGNGGPYDYSGSGDGGPATMAGLAGPGAIGLSPAGGVVFADIFRIRSFAVGGNIATIAGDGPANYFGDNEAATQAGLDEPSGVIADAQGNLYVADRLNSRIRRIDAVTGVITTIAGGGNLYGSAGDGKSALLAGFFPDDIALDGSDHLYVRDFEGLRVVDLKTGLITTLLPNVVTAGGMVFDGDKTLYIASSHLASQGPYSITNDQVWAIDLTTGTPTVIAGNGTIAALPTGDGGPATQASLWDVSGLALDGNGNLYLADHAFDDVRSIDLKTGIIQTIAGTHPNSPPAVGYSGDGGSAVNALFAYPSALTYDGAGHLTIADSGNHVLRQIDLATNIISTIAGNHTPGFGGDGASATAAMLYDPDAATYDPAGNLIIADTNNNRVRRVMLHPTKLNATLTYTGASSGGVTFTATYNGLSFGIAPTGTVTFLNGSTSLGTGTIAGAADGSGNYVATLTATSLLTDNTTITAQYSGDGNYAGGSSTVTLQQLAPFYTVSAKPASLTIKQGSSGSITFTVTPENGFNQAVSFACDNATLPQGVTCSFSPASVTPNGTAAVTSTLTVATTGAAVAAIDTRAKPRFGWLPGGGTALALLLFGIPGARRRSRVLISCVLMLVALSIGGGIVGCGGTGGSGSTGGGAQAANATPPGAYSIQVTTSVGTATSASPVTVSLTVTQ